MGQPANQGPRVSFSGSGNPGRGYSLRMVHLVMLQEDMKPGEEGRGNQEKLSEINDSM